MPSLQAANTLSQRTVVSIGNFDGVHIGHLAILRHARQVAQEHGAALVAMMFDPHPATILRPGQEPARLTDRDEKIQKLYEAGADNVVVLASTPELLNKTAEQFMRWLVDEYAPMTVVEGSDFRFGKDRGGDIHLLRRLGERMSFDVVHVDPVSVSLSDLSIAPLSSTLLRWLLGHGRVWDAGIGLGRTYELNAKVVQGEQRGRTIGVPTINLCERELIGRAIPGDAVYAGWVELPDGQRCLAATSVGVRPTFGQRQRVIEAHLLDYDGDLYGQRVTVAFCRWGRDQHPFPNVDALRSQLERDVAAVRRLACLDLLGPPRRDASVADAG